MGLVWPCHMFHVHVLQSRTGLKSRLYYKYWRDRPWRVGLFDFGSVSGRVWLETSGFEFGFGYCAYCGLKANSLVIFCRSISWKGTELKSECFAIQVMLRKNWNIISTYSSLHPTAMPPIQKNSVVPKKQASKVWRYFGDNFDGALQSVFCASTTQPKVSPTNHHLLINIHHFRFSLGPRFAKATPKPCETTWKHTTRMSISWWFVLRGSAKFWRHHESQSQLNIAKLVKMVFPVPAASSKSERVSFVRQCGHPQEGQVESWGGWGPRGGEVQLEVA